MTASDKELEKMYDWIVNSMKVDTWYPIKTDKAYDIIVQLFKEGVIDFCEFNEKETHIRKIDTELF